MVLRIIILVISIPATCMAFYMAWLLRDFFEKMAFFIAAGLLIGAVAFFQAKQVISSVKNRNSSPAYEQETPDPCHQTFVPHWFMVLVITLMALALLFSIFK